MRSSRHIPQTAACACYDQSYHVLKLSGTQVQLGARSQQMRSRAAGEGDQVGLRRPVRSPGAGGGGGRRLLAVHALDSLQDGGGCGAPPLAGRDGVLVRLRLGHPRLR